MAQRISREAIDAALAREVSQFEIQLAEAMTASDVETVETLNTEIEAWQAKLAEVFSTLSRPEQSLARKAAKLSTNALTWLAQMQTPETPPSLPPAPLPEQTIPSPESSNDPNPPNEPNQSASQPEAQTLTPESATGDPLQKPEPSEPPRAAPTRSLRKL